MKFDKERKTIEINRGDKGTLKLVNKNDTFKIGDEFKFSIMEKGDYDKVLFQKEFKVLEESNVFFLTFTSEDMRFYEPISKKKEFIYELEMNGDTTLIGYDEERDKKFVLYPEAGNKEEAN